MNDTQILECCFILSIDIDKPGPSVHLLGDIIDLFKKNEILIYQKSEKDEIDIEKTRTIKISAKRPPKWNLLGRYVADYRYAKRVIKSLVDNNVTAKTFFVQSSPLAYYIVKHLKKHNIESRVIYNAQDVFPDNIQGNNIIKKILFFPFAHLSKKLYMLSDHIITISPDIKTTIEKKIKERDKISVVHNWPNSTVIIENLDFKKRHNLEDKFVVLYAGNIGKFQDVEMVVKTAKKIDNDNIVFVIQGDGVRRKKIEKQVKNQSLMNVIFLPHDRLENMPTTYNSVDINLVTLKRDIYKTALPSKLPFCLNTRTPLIFTVERNSSIAEILADDNLTKTIAPGNIIDLRDEILYFYDNRDKIVYNTNIRKKILDSYFNPILNPKKYVEVILNINREVREENKHV
jgi:glycosyltransferase involved in cell wall biosynthesis